MLVNRRECLTGTINLAHFNGWLETMKPKWDPTRTTLLNLCVCLCVVQWLLKKKVPWICEGPRGIQEALKEWGGKREMQGAEEVLGRWNPLLNSILTWVPPCHVSIQGLGPMGYLAKLVPYMGQVSGREDCSFLLNFYNWTLPDIVLLQRPSKETNQHLLLYL